MRPIVLYLSARNHRRFSGIEPAFAIFRHGEQGRTNMRNTLSALVVFSGILCATAPIARAAAKVPGAEFMPAADIKWNDVPGFSGVQLAPLDGDPSKGPSHFLLKFVGGFSAPIHHHSSNHFVTVVSGTLVLTIDGKEHKLPAGSFFKFSDKTKHMTRCEPGAECVLSIDVRGKWDVVPDGDKSVAKK
jgi:quercetin dioxygenase-like cupin family protein